MNKRSRCDEIPKIQKIPTDLYEIRDELRDINKVINEAELRKKALWSALIRELEEEHEAMDVAARALPHTVIGQIFLKTLEGKTVTFGPLVSTHPVEYLKYLIMKKEKIDIAEMRLIYGKQLEDGRTLEDYGMRNLCSVNLNLRMRGC